MLVAWTDLQAFWLVGLEPRDLIYAESGKQEVRRSQIAHYVTQYTTSSLDIQLFEILPYL